MDIPKVSVIVPFYNSAATLPACLESLRAQTLKRLEIILVDDGSSDDSLDIAKAFAEGYEGSCTVLSQDNKGPSAARNKGLDVATGEFVAFVDSDDTVDPFIYEKMAKNADRYKSDIVSCGRAAIDETTGTVIKEIVPAYDALKGPICQCPDIVKRVGPLMCDKMFRRSIIECNSIRFDEDIWYAEDFLFGTRVKLCVDCVSAVREPLYRYVRTAGSITNIPFHIMDIPKASQRVLRLYKQAELFDLVESQLLFVLAGYYLRRCRSLPRDSHLLKEYKAEFKKLFAGYFGMKWMVEVCKRISKEDKGANRLTMFVKAIL